jgi:hypothetical protein
MAKSKWEQLHIKMNIIKKGIEQYVQKIKELVSQHNVFQMHFHRELLNPDQLTLNYLKYMEMAKTHGVFLKVLSSDVSLREEFEKPFLADPFFYLPLRSIPDITVNFKKMVKWSVRMEFSAGIIAKLNDLPFELLLYCSAYGEYGEIRKWFPDATHIARMHSLHIEKLGEEIILSNLAEPVNNLFSKFLKTYTLVEHTKQALPFSPPPQANIKIALEKVLECKENRRCGPYDLFKRWNRQVQSLVFQKTGWPIKKQEAYLLRIKRFRKHEKSKHQEPEFGCTKTTDEIFNEVLKSEVVCFDKRTMATIVQWFLEKFIHNHNDKKSGQIACILWLLIWGSHDIGDDILDIEKIIYLSSKEINLKNKSLLINKREIEISRGLMSLLSILIGKGKGIRSCRLFPDVNKRNFKYALEKAFKELFPNESPFFTLNSLLFFPHEFPGVKIPSSLLKKMKNPDAYAGKPGDLKVSVLKGWRAK